MTPSGSVERPAARQALLRRAWPEFAAALVWVVATLFLATMNVTQDIVWQLWIARQLNVGVGLYTWIMEVNPPLWYWMAQPIDLLATRSGLPPVTLLVVAVFLLIAVSLALSSRLVAHWSTPQRAALYGAMLASMVIVPLFDFGQREHLLLIAAIPYALLLAARVETRRIPLALALGVALLATPIFALKHYFVLVPMALELWLIWSRRRHWRPIRTETLMLVAGAIAYGLAMLVFTPDYLTSMVPALRLTYGDFRVNAIAAIINQMNLLLLVAGIYLFHFRRELHPAAWAMILVAAALVVSYYLQYKGWSYHAAPVIGALLLAVVLHLALRPISPALRWTEMLTAALATMIAVVPAAQQGPYRNDFAPYVAGMLAETRPGMSAVMLTSQPNRIWGMVDEWGLQWPSRYYHFWMLPTIANTLATGEKIEGPLLDIANRMRRETVADFTCNPPDVIIDDGISVDDVDFDVLAFFDEEPSFAVLMQSYQVQSTLGPFTVYERIADLPAPTGPCMTLAPAHHIYPRPGAPA